MSGFTRTWSVFLCLLGVSGTVLGQLAFQPGLVNGVHALVNDHAITLEDTMNLSRPALQAAARRSRTNIDFEREARKVSAEALEQLIERQLVIDEFNKTGFNFPESYIDDVVRSRIKREFGGDRLSLIRELRAMGQTYEAFRNDEKRAFIVTQMILKNVNQQLVVSPRKMEKYYGENQEKYRVGDRVKLRMMVFVIDLARHSRPEAEDLAEEALRRVRAGESFAAVADELSDDARRFKGGDRGWIQDRDADLRRELREVAFAMEAGTVSDIIDLREALFLIQVDEKEAARVRPLKDVRLEVENELRNQERERLQKAWIQRLRNNAFVRYY